jgi:hypothetical protein
MPAEPAGWAGWKPALLRLAPRNVLWQALNQKPFMTKKRHHGSSAPVNVTGEIRAADLDRGTFILRLSDGTRVRATFLPAQETLITGALREHSSRRLRLRGRGEFQRNGKLKRLVTVKHLEVRPVRPRHLAKRSKPFWKWVVELGESIPKEEWDRVPTDGAQNLDHYLYGHPKRVI